MKQIIFAALSVTLVAFTCNKDLPGEPAELTVNITQCRETTLRNQFIKVCLDSVKTDSRCPSDVQCVSIGAATASFTFTVGNQHTTQTLSLKNYIHPGHPTQLSYNGYRFEFILLEPYPRFSQPYPYSEYRATVRVTAL